MSLEWDETHRADICHCTVLRKAARRVSMLYDHALAPVGLRITQYALLAALARSGPVTITELARLMVMERNGLGHTIRTLERDGLVRTDEGPDARTRLVVLSAAGRRRLAAARPHWEAAQAQMAEIGDAVALRERLVALSGRPLGLAPVR